MVRKVGLTDSVEFTCLEDLQLSNSYMWGSAITLDYCGKENCVKGWKFGPYVRESYVIHIVKKGKGTFSTAGVKHELGPGQAFIIRPGEETTYRADDNDPWSYMWVGFHGYRADDFIEAMGFTKDKPVVEIKQMDVCTQCVERMLAASQITRINEVKRQSEVMMLFATIMEDNADKVKKPDNTEYPSKIYVKAALDFITEKYMNKIKIDDIAEFIGISRSHLTGSFKKEMGVSPQEYLINFRLEKAASMLRTTKEQINIIAYQCGYEDSLSFSKAFKQKYGMSPKAFRNMEIMLDRNDSKGDFTGATKL
jgi:AraC-like DNA-binding protein